MYLKPTLEFKGLKSLNLCINEKSQRVIILCAFKYYEYYL